MAEILHENHQGDSHFSVVRLAGTCDNWWAEHSELRMKQTPLGVKLVRFEEGKKSKQFELSGEEIDALVQARTSFLADIEVRKEAEEARIWAEVEQARELVATVCRDKGLPWELCESNGRFSLRDTQNDTTLIYPMQPASVLKTVKAYFVQRNLIEPEPEKPAGDDFDPFIDSDELP